MILQKIHAQASIHPTAIALQGMDIQLSYQALVSEILHWSAMLKQLAQPSAVALALDNSPAWIVLDLAVLAAGCSNVPVPAFFSSAQKQHALKDAGAA